MSKEKKLKQIPDNHGIERRRVLKIRNALFVMGIFKDKNKKLGSGDRVMYQEILCNKLISISLHGWGQKLSCFCHG